MLNDIINGISIKLDTLFGKEIYIEELEQGFDEPCFFILPLNPQHTYRLGKRAYREYPFDIHYFPKNNEEMYDVAEKLFELEYIELLDGTLLRATKMNYEKQEDVLHFFVQYGLFVNSFVERQESMDTLEIAKKG